MWYAVIGQISFPWIHPYTPTYHHKALSPKSHRAPHLWRTQLCKLILNEPFLKSLHCIKVLPSKYLWLDQKIWRKFVFKKILELFRQTTKNTRGVSMAQSPILFGTFLHFEIWLHHLLQPIQSTSTIHKQQTSSPPPCLYDLSKIWNWIESYWHNNKAWSNK